MCSVCSTQLSYELNSLMRELLNSAGRTVGIELAARWSETSLFPPASVLMRTSRLLSAAIGVALSATLANAASAQVLYNNGPVVDGTGLSIIRSGSTTFGTNVNQGEGYGIAEDFSVTSPWSVTGFSFFSYQIDSGGVFTFTGASWSIVAGDVNTGSVVASGSGTPTNGGLMGYRVSSSAPNSESRPIFQLDLDFPSFLLGAGSYWLRWDLTGSINSGPWAPPTSDGVVGNGHQLLSGSYELWLDGQDQQGAEFPFLIRGTRQTTVPEPTTLSMLAAGVLAMAAFARRRRTNG